MVKGLTVLWIVTPYSSVYVDKHTCLFRV